MTALEYTRRIAVGGEPPGAYAFAMEPTAELILANRSYLDHDARPGERGPAPGGAGGLLEAVRPVIAPWDGREGTTWIGAARGRYDRAWTDDAGFEVIQTPSGDIRHQRLFFDESDWAGHYAHVSNGFLWPLLHLLREPLPSLRTYYPAPTPPTEAQWRAFQAVNDAFAEAALATEAATCWVQDYQLGQVPELLRAKGFRGRTGFFLHTPFPRLAGAAPFLDDPSAAKFVEWLGGVLGADLIGVQTRGDVERLCEAAEALCGAGAADGGVRLAEGRFVRIAAFPVGIDTEALAAAARLAQLPADLRGRDTTLPLVVGLERADYTKGIPERLAAVTRALSRGARLEYAGFSSHTREGVAAYERLHAECERLTDEGSRVATERGLPFLQRNSALAWSEVLALMREADVLFTASLADGMNLVALQTAIAQASRPESERGVILVGRDAGVASTYHDFAEDGLVPFDPLDDEGAERALVEALEGRPGRISDRLIATVRERDAHAWGLSFLATLTEA